MPGINIADTESIDEAIKVCRQCDAVKDFLHDIEKAVKDENAFARDLHEATLCEERRAEEQWNAANELLEHCARIRESCNARHQRACDQVASAENTVQASKNDYDGAIEALTSAQQDVEQCQRDVNAAEDHFRQCTENRNQAQSEADCARAALQAAQNSPGHNAMKVITVVVGRDDEGNEVTTTMSVPDGEKREAAAAHVAQTQAAYSHADSKLNSAESQLATASSSRDQARDHLQSSKAHFDACSQAAQTCAQIFEESKALLEDARYAERDAQNQLWQAEEATADASRQRETARNDYDRSCEMTREADDHREHAGNKGQAIIVTSQALAQRIAGDVDVDIQALQNIHAQVQNYTNLR